MNCEKRNAILTDVLTVEEHNFIVSILQSSYEWNEGMFSRSEQVDCKHKVLHLAGVGLTLLVL